MKEHNMIGLRESLAQLTTDKLDAMLQTELERENPDSVRLILSVLEEREKKIPKERTPQKEAAWERYQERINSLRRKPKRSWNWVIKAASVLLIVGMFLVVVPQKVDAETFRAMLSRWKQDILEFFDPSEKVIPKEQVFQTDNEGLQQIYDAALEIGIEEPLIPMWFDAYDLNDCNIKITPLMNGVVATLVSSNDESIFRIDVYSEKPLHGYFGEESIYDTYEKNGVKFEITRNNGKWVAVWEKNNIEYFLTIDCQEETLRRILASIYVMEE